MERTLSQDSTPSEGLATPNPEKTAAENRAIAEYETMIAARNVEAAAHRIMNPIVDDGLNQYGLPRKGPKTPEGTPPETPPLKTLAKAPVFDDVSDDSTEAPPIVPPPPINRKRQGPGTPLEPHPDDIAAMAAEEAQRNAALRIPISEGELSGDDSDSTVPPTTTTSGKPIHKKRKHRTSPGKTTHISPTKLRNTLYSPLRALHRQHVHVQPRKRRNSEERKPVPKVDNSKELTFPALAKQKCLQLLEFTEKKKVACKMGRIYVNGEQMTDVDYVMKNGDRVEHWVHRHEHPVRDLPIRIISETDDLLVIEKPPSLPVHTCGQYAIHTVLGQLRENEGKTGLRVLHRLDRATSGVLLFAKNYETDLEFKTTLKQGEWSKEYVCKVDGVFPDEEQVCEQPIGPLVISMGIQCVRHDGKDAKSTFRKLWSDGTHSVVQVHIETGRTHQIRVHSQFLGYPIVGDQLYNSTVWGPTRGKNADYQKGFDELCEDVRNTHKSENWHEKPNPEFERRMEHLASDSTDITPESPGISSQERPEFDEICQKCNVESKKVPDSHFQLFLHCLKYETPKWCYKTELPEWAVQK